MSGPWVAVTVRAKAMARRRLGSSGVRRLAAMDTLDSAVAALAGTAYDGAQEHAGSLEEIQQWLAETVLWDLRVLAGWFPGAGAPLARAVAARFELANIERRLAVLTGRASRPCFELGPLATSWPRLAAATTTSQLRTELAGSPWHDPGPLDGPAWFDVLYRRWLQRLAAAAPEGSAAVRGWVASALALPSEVGPAGEGPEQWRAEAELRRRIETDGLAMLRVGLPGPVPVLGAVAVLATDAWRVWVALLSASGVAAGSGVLDVVA